MELTTNGNFVVIFLFHKIEEMNYRWRYSMHGISTSGVDNTVVRFITRND
jgi:hypothetical protein